MHFFFQAEDGIRALTVTGVQTCALPISPPTRSWSGPGPASAGCRSTPWSPAWGRRSEERRVGKEGGAGERLCPLIKDDPDECIGNDDLADELVLHQGHAGPIRIAMLLTL